MGCTACSERRQSKIRLNHRRFRHQDDKACKMDATSSEFRVDSAVDLIGQQIFRDCICVALSRHSWKDHDRRWVQNHGQVRRAHAGGPSLSGELCAGNAGMDRFLAHQCKTNRTMHKAVEMMLH